jgi:hypothetical protein
MIKSLAGNPRLKLCLNVCDKIRAGKKNWEQPSCRKDGKNVCLQGFQDKRGMAA